VRQFLDAGVPARKLVIGAAFYGREFGDVSPAHDGLYQPYKKYIGEIPWPRLKSDFINRNGFVRHWDPRADAAWLWNPQTRTFITYEDPASIAAKAAFVKAHHLGGIMYWEQSLDPTGELLDAIRHGLD
jgi:chitinase